MSAQPIPLHRWIIGFGWDQVDAIEAPSRDAAYAIALERTKAIGLDEDFFEDCVWAEKWTDDLAHDLGLYEPPLAVRKEQARLIRSMRAL